jgi:hypothetical protein
MFGIIIKFFAADAIVKTEKSLSKPLKCMACFLIKIEKKMVFKIFVLLLRILTEAIHSGYE